MQSHTVEKLALMVAFVATGMLILKKAETAGWKKFASADGRFTVMMPDHPHEERRLITINGVQLESRTFSADHRDANYTVAYVDGPATLSADASEKMFDEQRRALVQGDESRMLSAEKIMIGGYPGHKYQVRIDEHLQADEQVLLVRRRLYSLLVLHDPGSQEPAVNRFFDSFTLQSRE